MVGQNSVTFIMKNYEKDKVFNDPGSYGRRIKFQLMCS
jgi:hypothetical protein